MFETFFAKLAGKFLSKKLKLEDTMDDTKQWYLSRGIWTGIVTALIGLYLTLAPHLHLPAIPEWIFIILGTLKVYTRVTADTKIG